MNVLDPKSGILAGELPCGFLVNGKVQKDYVVREMTGEEEDLLAGRGSALLRLNQVITNCTVSVGGVEDKQTVSRIVKGLTAVDRMVMLLDIRRATLGDLYNMRLKCPSCSQESSSSVNLSHVERVPMEEPELRDREDTLESGLVVKWHIMTGKDEEWLTKASQRLKGKGQATLAMLSRVDEIDGEALDRVKALPVCLKKLKGLRMRDRLAIRALFKKHEGTVDTEVDWTCIHCGHSAMLELDVGQEGFFFPADQ